MLTGLLLLFTAGCQPSIEVVQPQSPLPQPIATVAPAAHAIALIGVDFDPPLEQFRITASASLTLLVAVENRGLLAEPQVAVTARLWDPAVADAPVMLLDETVLAREVASGEVRIVRFSEVQRLPVRNRYVLEVAVTSAAGDAFMEDNVRRYDIVVHDEAR